MLKIKPYAAKVNKRLREFQIQDYYLIQRLSFLILQILMQLEFMEAGQVVVAKAIRNLYPKQMLVLTTTSPRSVLAIVRNAV